MYKYGRNRKRKRRKRGDSIVDKYRRRTGKTEDSFPPPFAPKLVPPRPGSGS